MTRRLAKRFFRSQRQFSFFHVTPCDTCYTVNSASAWERVFQKFSHPEEGCATRRSYRVKETEMAMDPCQDIDIGEKNRHIYIYIYIKRRECTFEHRFSFVSFYFLPVFLTILRANEQLVCLASTTRKRWEKERERERERERVSPGLVKRRTTARQLGVFCRLTRSRIEWSYGSVELTYSASFRRIGICPFLREETREASRGAIMLPSRD